MKNYKNLICALFFLACALSSQALTIKISGIFTQPPTSNIDSPLSFGVFIDYDPNFAPEYLAAGTLVSGAGTIQQDFYLFSLDGIRSFTAYAGAVSTSIGSWGGKESPSDGIDKLWFDADFRTVGTNVHTFFGGFSSPNLTIGFGSWGYTWGSVEPIAIDDVFIYNPNLGFSPGDYEIHVTPESFSTAWLVVSGLAGLICLRSYRGGRSK